MSKTVKDIDIYDRFIKQIKSFAEGLGIDTHIEREDIQYEDGFYEKNDRIFNSSDDWFEDIDVDFNAWLKHDYELQTDFKLNEVSWVEDIANEILKDEYIKTWETLQEEVELGELTLDEIETHEKVKKIYQPLIVAIKEAMDDKNFYDFRNDDELKPLFGIEYPDEEFNDLDVLAYWTIYFSPCRKDDKIARDCGLFPFEYDGEFYLALGGCGMDLSPKLDAYQALTDGTIPKGSQFIEQPDYAKYVVGEETYNKVMEAIKLPKPIIKIRVY